jgi:hypothetical protein
MTLETKCDVGSLRSHTFSLETKLNEYSRLFLKLEKEEPQLYERIRTYCNSCMGIETKGYKPDPKIDLQYLEIELSKLIDRKPEYNNVAYELYKRMNEFAKGGK